MQQSGARLKGLRRIATPRCPTRGEVAAFIELNGGVLMRPIPSVQSPAGRFRFVYRCPLGHLAKNTLYDFRRKRWCKDCSWNRLTHQDCVKYAAERNGSLRTPYRDTIKDTDTLHFRCEHHHDVPLTGTAIKAEKWCRECQRLARRVDEERFATTAKQRGGVFLGRGKEKGCNTLRFRCSAGHEFGILYANYRNGRWCLTCASGLGERIVKEVVETLFGQSFPKTRPGWLEMRPGSYLELDGYNPELRIAFEHHGRQHYGSVRMKFPTDFSKQKKRDTFKRDRCLEQGVRLIEVPEVFGLTPVEQVRDVVIAECKRLGIRIPKGRQALEPDLDKAYWTQPLQELLAQLSAIVESKGGELVALDKTAVSSARLIPVVIRCERQHEWPTRVGLVLDGHWCRKCYRLDYRAFLDGELSSDEYEKRYGISEPRGVRIRLSDVKSLALECGVPLLSDRYRSAKKPMQFECTSCGNAFPMTYDRLKQQRPSCCPDCSSVRAGLERRYTLDELQSLASSNKGFLLSWRYRGISEPLRWWCSGCEESFQRPADPIVQGGWCQTCSRRAGAKRRVSTIRKKSLQRRRSKIEALVRRKKWTVVSNLERCITDNAVVSLVCSHGLPFSRTWRYLTKKGAQCDCTGLNSPVRGRAELIKVLQMLRWTMESAYVDGKHTVKVRCEHGTAFERIAGGITPDSKCECEKRGTTGTKYIAQRASGRFQVSVTLGCDSHTLGTFNTLEEAVKVRDAFCRKHGKLL